MGLVELVEVGGPDAVGALVVVEVVGTVLAAGGLASVEFAVSAGDLALLAGGLSEGLSVTVALPVSAVAGAVAGGAVMPAFVLLVFVEVVLLVVLDEAMIMVNHDVSRSPDVFKLRHNLSRSIMIRHDRS